MTEQEIRELVEDTIREKLTVHVYVDGNHCDCTVQVSLDWDDEEFSLNEDGV